MIQGEYKTHFIQTQKIITILTGTVLVCPSTVTSHLDEINPLFIEPCLLIPRVIAMGSATVNHLHTGITVFSIW